MRVITSFFLIGVLWGLCPSVVKADRVKNLVAQKEILMVCNYPESVLAPGTIFKKSLENEAVRVFYYYKNGTSFPLQLTLLLKNKTTTLETVKMIHGIAGPSPDGLYAGHKASKVFFQQVLTNHLSSKTLSPHQSSILFTQALKPDEISTGMFWVRADSKGALELSFQVDDPHFSMLTSPISDLRDSNFFIGRYPQSHRKLSVSFEPKDEIKEIEIGGKPFLRDKKTGVILKGNYGVLHIVELLLSNPSQKTETLELMFSRVSGIARNVMVIDEVLYETKQYQSNDLENPEPIKYLTLKPHQEQKMTLYLFPQAGGFYPANLVIRRVPLGEIYDT